MPGRFFSRARGAPIGLAAFVLVVAVGVGMVEARASALTALAVTRAGQPRHLL